MWMVPVRIIRLLMYQYVGLLVLFVLDQPIRPPSYLSPMRPDSPRDFGAIQIIYLLTYLYWIDGDSESQDLDLTVEICVFLTVSVF